MDDMVFLNLLYDYYQSFNKNERSILEHDQFFNYENTIIIPK